VDDNGMPVETGGETADTDTDIDLTDRLRSAAGSLAAAFGDEVTIDLAEELVFSCAEALLAAASVTDFVPILAERRARQAVRTVGGPSPAPTSPPPAPPEAAIPMAVPAVPTPGPGLACSQPPFPPRAAAATPAASRRPGNGVSPRFAVEAAEMTRLRDDLGRIRQRVDGWLAGLSRR
jgi:hypothetical protein